MSRDLVDLECTNGELKEEVETLEVIRYCSYSRIQIMIDNDTLTDIATILTFAAQCYQRGYLTFKFRCTVLPT
jgi:hypothetical protein